MTYGRAEFNKEFPLIVPYCTSCGKQHGACIFDNEGNCKYKLREMEDKYWKTIRTLNHLVRKQEDETNQRTSNR